MSTCILVGLSILLPLDIHSRLPVYLYPCLHPYLATCLPVYLTIYLLRYLYHSFCLSIHFLLSIFFLISCLPVYPSDYSCTYSTIIVLGFRFSDLCMIYLSIHLPVYLSFCPSVYLSIFILVYLPP